MHVLSIVLRALAIGPNLVVHSLLLKSDLPAAQSSATPSSTTPGATSTAQSSTATTTTTTGTASTAQPSTTTTATSTTQSTTTPGADDSPQVFLLHIAKTAGVSARRDLPRHHLRDGVNFCEDEICYGALPKHAEYITFLREPTGHLLSQYLMCLRYKAVPGHIFVNNTVPDSFGAWLEHYAAGANGSSDPKVPPLGCYHPENLQSRILSCKSGAFCPGLDTQVLGDGAEAFQATHSASPDHLARFKYVGVTELYQESMCVIHIMEKLEYPSYCDCTDAAAWEAFPHANMTHGSKGNTSRELGEDEVRLAIAMTAIDRMLYNKAVQNLAAMIEAIEAWYGKKIMCKPLPVVSTSGSGLRVAMLDADDGEDEDKDAATERARGLRCEKVGTRDE